MDIWSDPTRRRWVVWVALALGFLLVNVHRLSSAVLSEDLMRAFDATGSQLGTLHSSFFYVYAPMQVAAGVLSDRLGIRTTATVGVLVMSLGGVAFGLAEVYPVAFLARLCIGLGASVIFIATLRFCANWYRPDEFATMNGLTIAIAGLGGILATTPLSVFQQTVGLRMTFFALGGAGFVIAVVVWLLARDTPADAGLEPVDNVPSSPTLSLRDVAANARTVLRGRDTWLAGIALFCSTGLNLTVLGLWGVPYIVHLYDVSVPRASSYVLLGNLGLLVGPPVVGWLSDRVGRRIPIMFAAVCTFVLAYAVIFATVTPPLVVVGVVLFAANFTAGGNILAYAVVKERHAAAASGTVTGTVNSIGYFGAAVFPAAMGAVLDAYWTGETVAGARIYTAFGYRVAFGIAVLSGLLSLACLVWFYLRYVRGSTDDGSRAGAGV